ncbi:hypothetical protein BB560_004611, partial [Smittium megazygosporum]
MMYEPPVLNKIDISPDPASLTPATTVGFSQRMWVVLSDLASHVSQVRMDEAYRVSKIPRKAPQLLPGTSQQPFENKTLVEHLGTLQAWKRATNINKGSNKRGYMNMKENYSRFTDNGWVQNVKSPKIKNNTERKNNYISKVISKAAKFLVQQKARNPYQCLFEQLADFGINKERISQEYDLGSKAIIKNRHANESSKFINPADSSINTLGNKNKHEKHEPRCPKLQGHGPLEGSKSISKQRKDNYLRTVCIRHLTMSTTDPSAAKPDGFAIGSISKRDRSGSGDEAAPVYPVKHPTMSYAGAAKGRPAAQSSECKIGCSWDQFGDNASDAVESICRQLFDLRMTMQHDRPSKSTYYIVKDEQAAERLLNGPLFYEGKKIEFFQTVHYEEE